MPDTKIPHTLQLNNPTLIKAALSLNTTGKIGISINDLAYLKVEDAYIHQLFPLLQAEDIQKPDYFGIDSVGAHISVIYPEEAVMINRSDLNQIHHFRVTEIVRAEVGMKMYYALLVDAPSLLQLRRKYGLPDQLCLKGYLLDLHITIGVR